MDSVPLLETAEKGADGYVNFTDDISSSKRSSVEEVGLSDPILPLLPLDGYRILDTPSSSLTPPINNDYISFEKPNLHENAPTRSKSTFFSICKFLARNWSNILLIFVPVGIFAPELGCGDTLVFIFNCLAVIPLADVLCRATDETASFLGETTGALLNVTLGNATELAIFHALLQRQYTIVRTSLLGSIIVNLLLVLGLSIIAGETQMRGQVYNVVATRVAAGLLCLTTVSLLVPSTVKFSAESVVQKRDVLGLSRGTSIVLIVVYCIYLWGQIKSSKFSYKPLIALDDEAAVSEVQESVELGRASTHRRTLSYPGTYPPFLPPGIEPQPDSLHILELPDPSRPKSLLAKMGTVLDRIKSMPWVRKAIPIIVIIVSTCLTSMSGDLLVSSIDHLVDHSPISRTSVGLIILPIVGNVSELITGVIFAYRKQIDLAFAVCIGSAIQIALFVAPLVVLIGWGVGREMSLHFTMFEAITLVASTMLFFSLIFDDRCSSLKGASFLAGYTIIGLASHFVSSKGD